MSELLFYIICNGSHLGDTGKSRYLEDQIKNKLEKKLIIEVRPKFWEHNSWLLFWINFYSSFISIYDTHMKFCESKKVVEKIWELGSLQIERKRELRHILDREEERKVNIGMVFGIE
jgi:hypothetical protein